MSTKVLLTKAFFDTDLDYLKAGLDKSVEIVKPAEFNESSVLAALPEADVLLGGMLTEPVLEAASETESKVAFFQIPWTGVDTLNFDVIKRTGVTVCNSHSNSTVVAEHGVGMLLAAAKKLCYHDRKMREGEWNRVAKEGNEVSPFSASLVNRHCLLIGCGAIGSRVAQMLNGFGCTFSSVTHRGEANISGLRQAFNYSQLYSALSEADYIFVSVPLTDNTKHMIDSTAFDAMKISAILVNVSRGDVLVEDDLYNALNEQKIAGAAVDTWYQYPSATNKKPFPSATNDFHKLNNIVMSPHRAGYVDAGFPHLDDAIENINRHVAGKPLLNIVGSAQGY